MKTRNACTAILALGLAAILVGCTSATQAPAPTATPIPPTDTPVSLTATPEATPTPWIEAYAFPESIDPAARYLFYLHGKIIEDQGLQAVSPEFGEYAYQEILETLSGYGFVVISEPRPKNAISATSANKVSSQVRKLLEAGVPAGHITVVGASKGAGITVIVSSQLQNSELNYVIMAICYPDEVQLFIQNQMYLSGKVLSIYDSNDTYAGSCGELFAVSEGKGLSSYDEILLDVGTGHGILYQPLDEWVLPVVDWAMQANP